MITLFSNLKEFKLDLVIDKQFFLSFILIFIVCYMCYICFILVFNTWFATSFGLSSTVFNAWFATSFGFSASK